MPYDTGLAARLQELLQDLPGMDETRMMGGFGYILNGNLCVGVFKDTLMIRVGVEMAQKILKEPHVRPMDFTGKVMKGWAIIEPEGIEEDADLEKFCALAIEFVETLPHKFA